MVGKVIGIKLHAFRFAVSKIAPGIHHRFQRKDRLLSRDKSLQPPRLRKSYLREFYKRRWNRFLSRTCLFFTTLLCVLLITTLCIFATLSLSLSLSFFLRREIKDERIERYDNYVRRHKLTDLTLVSKLAFPFAFLFRARIPDINFQFR